MSGNSLSSMVGSVPLLIPINDSNNSSLIKACNSQKEHKGFMTLGPKRRIQKALMNLVSKNKIK